MRWFPKEYRIFLKSRDSQNEIRWRTFPNYQETSIFKNNVSNFFSILSFSAGTIGTLVGVYWGLPSSIKYGLVLFLSTSYELKIFTN